MKIENVEVYGWRSSLRGMRNPMESYHKSDTIYECGEKEIYSEAIRDYIWTPEAPNLGPNDLDLACRLIKGGSEHRKFVRQIMMWVDLTLPRYVWTELDTYKIATVRNSCSTMHTLGFRALAQNDFESPIPQGWLDDLNRVGEEFRIAKQDKNKDLVKQLRRELKNILPEGFLQKSTYMMNYETALTMYFQRRSHRLPEWNIKNEHSICSFVESLPYMKTFIEAVEK